MLKEVLLASLLFPTSPATTFQFPTETTSLTSPVVVDTYIGVDIVISDITGVPRPEVKAKHSASLVMSLDSGHTLVLVEVTPDGHVKCVMPPVAVKPMAPELGIQYGIYLALCDNPDRHPHTQ